MIYFPFLAIQKFMESKSKLWTFYIYPEAAIQRCFREMVFWKYTVNSQDNTHAEMRFQ